MKPEQQYIPFALIYILSLFYILFQLLFNQNVDHEVLGQQTMGVTNLFVVAIFSIYVFNTVLNNSETKNKDK